MGILRCPGGINRDDAAPGPASTLAMIVAIGENYLEIPCLTFATVKEAEQFLTDRFGPPSRGQWGPIATRDMRHCAGDFFTAYYDGSGGIDTFEVHTVQHGKPIVMFDLS